MSPAASSSPLLTLPNLLSLSRLPLGGLFWIALGPGARSTTARAVAALGVMGLAAVTDMLDGYFARRRGDNLAGAGSWLDPVCDKLFVAAVLGALHVQRGVSLGLLALIVSRELLQLPMALVYRVVPTLHHWLQYDFRASALGKAATCAQFLAIAALVVGVPTSRPGRWRSWRSRWASRRWPTTCDVRYESARSGWRRAPRPTTQAGDLRTQGRDDAQGPPPRAARAARATALATALVTALATSSRHSGPSLPTWRHRDSARRAARPATLVRRRCRAAR